MAAGIPQAGNPGGHGLTPAGREDEERQVQMNENRSKSGATPKRDAVRRANVAKRRADLSGTAPWAFRVPQVPAPPCSRPGGR